MIRIINEEPVTFGIRLKELLKENNLSQKQLAMIINVQMKKRNIKNSKGNYVKISNDAVSKWITGKAKLTNYRKDILSILAKRFDVDQEYLECTQLDRKEKKSSRKDRKRKRASASISKWKDKISQEEEIAIKEMLSIEKEKRWKIQQATQLFKACGIIIEPDYRDSHTETIENTYQILQDSCVYTVCDIQEIVIDGEPDRYTISLPGGTETTKSRSELLDLYDVIRVQCLSQFD